jgi:hypothetical protein
MGSVTFLNFLPGHRPNEYIVLPPQSLLGRFEGLDDQPTGIWPITLLCLWHGHVSEYSAEAVQYGAVPTMDRTKATAALWVIECECAQGNCGRKRLLFAFGDVAQTDDHVRLRVVQTNPTIPCVGHAALLDAGKMEIEKLIQF